MNMTEATGAAPALIRCAWAGADPLMQQYHDEEWGVPCHDDRALFERRLVAALIDLDGDGQADAIRRPSSFRLQRA